MKKSELKLLLLLGGSAASLSASAALAQSYPVKPIRMLVGFSAGTGLDIAARLAAQKVSDLLVQPVIVENRPGASGSIATELVVKSPADGYTLLVMSPTETALPALRAKLAYDLVRDLAPVSMIATTAFVLVVHPSVPARNVKDVIALARSHPGKLSFGATGIKQGLEPQASTPEQFSALIRREVEQNATLVRAIGLAKH